MTASPSIPLTEVNYDTHSSSSAVEWNTSSAASDSLASIISQRVFVYTEAPMDDNEEFEEQPLGAE